MICGRVSAGRPPNRQSLDSGGEASYDQWDTRPSWVFRIRHPVGAQGKQCCRVGNIPEARPTLRECAVRGCFPRARFEVHGRARKWVSSPGENYMCAEDRYSPDG